METEGEAEKGSRADFVIPELRRAAPYGDYDLAQNIGWVSVGVDHDTVRGGNDPEVVTRDGQGEIPAGSNAYNRCN